MKKIWKWLYGSAGPMVTVLADDEAEAKKLAVEFLKAMDPDDHPEAPESWLNNSELEVIELNESRVISSA